MVEPFLDSIYTLGGAAIHSEVQDRVTMYVADEFVDNGDLDLEVAAEAMWELLGEAILAGRFSFSKGIRRYRKFKKEDLDIVHAAIGMG